MYGVIKTVKLDRGFGFITGEDETVARFFFHFRDLAPSLPFTEALLNRRVTFNIEDTERGPRARAIQPAQE